MSSLLWFKNNDKNYYYSDRPCIGNLTESDVKMNFLGSYQTIRSTLSSHYFAQAFTFKNIYQKPLEWAARFIFLERELKIVTRPEDIFLSEMLETLDPEAWINNEEFIKMIQQGLIKYSSQL